VKTKFEESIAYLSMEQIQKELLP